MSGPNYHFSDDAVVNSREVQVYDFHRENFATRGFKCDRNSITSEWAERVSKTKTEIIFGEKWTKTKINWFAMCAHINVVRLCTSGLCYKVNYMWSSVFLFTVFQAHIHWRARFHAVHQQRKLKRSLSTQHENRGYRELVVTHTPTPLGCVLFFFAGSYWDIWLSHFVQASSRHREFLFLSSS